MPLDPSLSPPAPRGNASEGWPAGPTLQPMPASSGASSSFALYLAVGCAGLAFLSLCAVGIGAIAWGAARGGSTLAAGPTVHLRGQVTSYIGSAAIGAGTLCEMPIEQVSRPDGTTWCHVRMTCGGAPLYGGDENGFFPCTFSPSGPGVPGRVAGQDLETSTSDRDGAFTVSTDTRTFEAHDDGAGPNGFFAVTGTIIAIE